VGKKVAPMKKAIEMKPALRKVTPKKVELQTKADGMATTGGKTAAVPREHDRSQRLGRRLPKRKGTSGGNAGALFNRNELIRTDFRD